jgi:hypothetical protein
MFCPRGRFVPLDVLSQGGFVPLDILFQGHFVPGWLVSGCFVSGRFVYVPIKYQHTQSVQLVKSSPPSLFLVSYVINTTSRKLA